MTKRAQPESARRRRKRRLTAWGAAERLARSAAGTSDRVAFQTSAAHIPKMRAAHAPARTDRTAVPYGVRSTPTPKNCRGSTALVNVAGAPVPGIAGDRASRSVASMFVVPYSR